MEYYNKETIKQKARLDDPKPFLFETPKSSMHFAWAGVKNQISQQPIRYGIQVVFVVLALLWGVFTGHWKALILFLVLSLILRGILVGSYIRLHRVLHKDACYKIDKYGISLMGICDDGLVRYVTDSWTLVKKVVCHRNFVVIEMEKEAEGASEYLLFHQDMGEACSSILRYWQLTLDGVKPEEQPDHYTAQEISDMKQFIESRFGEIEAIAHESQSDRLHIDMAIVRPTEDRPYYTVCTIGAGALRLNVPEELRLEWHEEEYAEYLIHLPANWNVMGEGYDREENWWPLRLLKTVARLPLDAANFYADADDMIGWEADTSSADVRGTLLDCPLPDISTKTTHTLPTGRTVKFLQIIPITHEEYDFCKDNDDLSERYLRVFGSDLAGEEDKTEEDYTRIILGHYAQLYVGEER